MAGDSGFGESFWGEPIMESSLALSGSMPRHIEANRRLFYLGAVFALAAALRAWVASADLPFYFETDEAILLYQTGILGLGHMNPNFFDWPGSLQFHVLAFIFWLFYLYSRASGRVASASEYSRLFWTSPGPFCALARCLNVACGVTTVCVVSRLVRPLGLIAVTVASCLVVFSPTHVRNSARAMTDVPATLMMMVAVGRFSQIVQKTSRRAYFHCGLWIGLATANKYYAAFTFAGIFTAALLVSGAQLAERFQVLALAGLGGLVGFSVGCPFALLDYPSFFLDLNRQLTHQQAGHVGFEPEGNRFAWFTTHVLVPAVGWPALVLALVGCCLALTKSGFREYCPHVAVLALLYGVLGNSHVSFDRYAVPLIPLIAVMCALSVSWVARRWRALAILIIVVTVAGPATMTLEMCYEQSKVDTRYAAAAILSANGIHRRRVLTTSSGPKVPGADIIDFWEKPPDAIVAALRHSEYTHVVTSSVDFDYTLAPMTRQKHPEVYAAYNEIKSCLKTQYDIAYCVEPSISLKGSTITVYRARSAGTAPDQPRRSR
jgi:hypothetical protein